MAKIYLLTLALAVLALMKVPAQSATISAEPGPDLTALETFGL